MKRILIGILCLLAMTCFGQITTKNVVPNTNNTGWIGVTNKKWQGMMSYTGKFDYLFGNGAGLSNLPAGTGAVSSVTLISSNPATLLIASNGTTGHVTNWLSVIGSSTDTNTVLVLASNMAVALDDGVLQSATNYANTILQSATNYANTILQSATNYSDAQDILVLQSATNYANTILQSATNYADSKDILVLQSSTNYADAQDILVLQSSTNYADSVAGRGESNASYVVVRSTNSLPNALGLFNNATNLIPQMFKATDWLWTTNSGTGFDTVLQDGGAEDWELKVNYNGNINIWNTNEIPNGIYRMYVTASLETNSEAWMYSGNVVVKHWTNNPTTPYAEVFNGLVQAGGKSNIWFKLGHGDPVSINYITLAINTNETKLAIRDGDNQTFYGTTKFSGMIDKNVGIGTNTMQNPTNVPAVLTVAGTNTPVLFAVSHGGGSGASNIFTVSANGLTTNRGTFYNTGDIIPSSVQVGSSGGYFWITKVGFLSQILNRTLAINQFTNVLLGTNTAAATNYPSLRISGGDTNTTQRPSVTFVGPTNDLPVDVKIQGDLYLTNSVSGNVIASNFVYRTPRWVDEKIGGMMFTIGVAPPDLTVIAGEIQGLGWNPGEYSFWSLQAQHGTASTNANFPDWYCQPHLHISSPPGLNVAESNITFALDFQGTYPGGDYGAVQTLYGTGTITATNTHYILSFGFYTNNALQGRDSLVFRGRLLCTNSATGEISTRVIVDSMDIHIPVDAYGSAAISGDSP